MWQRWVSSWSAAVVHLGATCAGVPQCLSQHLSSVLVIEKVYQVEPQQLLVFDNAVLRCTSPKHVQNPNSCCPKTTNFPEILSPVNPLFATHRTHSSLEYSCAQIKSFAHLNPVVLFSGDAFNPSLMSTITLGKQMVGHACYKASARQQPQDTMVAQPIFLCSRQIPKNCCRSGAEKLACLKQGASTTSITTHRRPYHWLIPPDCPIHPLCRCPCSMQQAWPQHALETTI